MNKNIPYACPCSTKSALTATASGYVCNQNDCVHSSDDHGFPVFNGIPILISEQKCDTVCVSGKTQSYVQRRASGRSLLKKLIVGESNTTKKNCEAFIDQVLLLSSQPKVLVIGSGERGAGTDALWNHEALEIHGVDIYGSNFVDAVCDAHYLPLQSNSYDGVWIQAVLEHVVQPSVVVDEIFRVLKLKGVAYAETPFMQQVHEGAYDFTRYTVLGHRYLFKKFEAIDYGGNKGPELVFAWSARYLTWSVTRSRKLGRLVGLITGILMRPLSYLTSKESMHDASSGVFFLGRKLARYELTHKELVKLYRGQF